MDMLPILAELRAKYADRDLTILPVFINSGDVDQIASRAWEMDLDFPLVVSEDKSISTAYESRMVPSTFLIDEKGRVTRKLVGFKSRQVLDQALANLADSNPEA
jgi:peroxiredoxin